MRDEWELDNNNNNNNNNNRDVMAGAGHSVVDDTREDLETIIATVCDPLTQTLENTAAKLPR